MGPPDAILGINEAFKKETRITKINLGVGAYRDDNGKPFVLPSVIEAEKRILKSGLDKEYAPIAGQQAYCNAVAKLAFADKVDQVLPRAAVIQGISGTGSLRLGMAFLNKYAQHKEIYMPTPTWGNHIPLSTHSGLTPKTYRYFHPETCGLDFNGMCEDLRKLPKHSLVLLHACAHNPTGVDPSTEQWKELANVCKKAELIPFFDMAYQGFASGDINKDNQALRIFIGEGLNFLLAQSFAKNMGLYGERAGAFSVVCNDGEERDRVMSQMKIIVRAMYSNPPIHGARIVETILNDESLRAQWYEYFKTY